ncbi:MAG TPA: UrcA family protein [Steroidobacteraceae bacterium]|jgi:UrcA family protein|nr:UrcA family protein [Steroidobacteraceae bacterium]
MKTLIISAAAIACISAMNVSRADSDLPSVAIRYAASDLGSGRGAAALYQKLKMAAREVCKANLPSTSSFTQHVASAGQQQCIDDALATGVARINVAAFTAYANAQHVGPTRYIVAHE